MCDSKKLQQGYLRGTEHMCPSKMVSVHPWEVSHKGFVRMAHLCYTCQEKNYNKHKRTVNNTTLN